MKKDDILKLAIERAREAESADRINREAAQDDLRFAIGEQWEAEDRSARELEGRPTLTINRMPQFIRQVTGQIRQINPAIRVTPSDNAASNDVAEIMEGLIRAIQYNSDADSVFEAAAESAAACGIGHFRIRSDYVNGLSFEQEILIERIHNPFAVLYDPYAKHPTRRDARYALILEAMPADAFKEAYPDARAEDVSSVNRDAHIWAAGDTVTVAEYYWIETEEVEIGLLRDGRVIQSPPAFADVVQKRTATVPRVKWAKITGAEVLEGPLDVPGRYIPVVAVTGEEWCIGEQMYRSSVIRFAKDPQRLYNYSRSVNAEILMTQPKAPYLVTQKQVSGFEEEWASANRTNLPYLRYNADPNAPMPARIPPPVTSQGVMAEIMQSVDDMKSTTGIFDASLGARSNETSGVAIAQRKHESQMANSVYADNMAKAILHAGQIIVDMIPVIYDTRRIVKILGEDGTDKLVEINQLMQSINGPISVNDMTTGQYSVRISIGPTYDTKRQEASTGMLDFIKAFPPAATVTADLIAKAQDWPDADQFAERLRKVLPPGVLEIDDLPEDQRAQMQASAAQAQQMQQMQAQMAMAKAQADVRKTLADASESEADARKAAVEAAQAQFELMVQSGQMQQIIQRMVAETVQGLMMQASAPPPPMAMLGRS